MTKKDLIESLGDVPEDADIKVVLQDDGNFHEIEEFEPGAVLTIEDVGYEAVLHTHVLRVQLA